MFLSSTKLRNLRTSDMSVTLRRFSPFLSTRRSSCLRTQPLLCKLWKMVSVVPRHIKLKYLLSCGCWWPVDHDGVGGKCQQLVSGLGQAKALMASIYLFSHNYAKRNMQEGSSWQQKCCSIWQSILLLTEYTFDPILACIKIEMTIKAKLKMSFGSLLFFIFIVNSTYSCCWSVCTAHPWCHPLFHCCHHGLISHHGFHWRCLRFLIIHFKKTRRAWYEEKSDKLYFRGFGFYYT